MPMHAASPKRAHQTPANRHPRSLLPSHRAFYASATPPSTPLCLHIAAPEAMASRAASSRGGRRAAPLALALLLAFVLLSSGAAARKLHASKNGNGNGTGNTGNRNGVC